jgi:hypothetical protein
MWRALGDDCLVSPRAGDAIGARGDFAGPIRWSQPSVGLLHIAADHLRREYEAARTETIPNAREVLRASGGSALFAVMRSERDAICASYRSDRRVNLSPSR